jgi:hypothetical protein
VQRRGKVFSRQGRRRLTAVPRPTDSVADLEPGDLLANLDDITDQFVARHTREHVAKVALRNSMIREANSACQDLDENLTGTWVLEVNLFEGKLSTLGLYEGCSVFGRE